MATSMHEFHEANIRSMQALILGCGPGAAEAQIDLRKNLAITMAWLDDWDRRRTANAP